MVVALLLIFAGVVLLYFGAEGLVLGGARIALRCGVTQLVVGLTVVAFSTSTPEVLASLIAAIREGDGDLALGNVIGSNIANIGLVLGLSALVRPLELHHRLWRREMPIVVGVAILLSLLMLGSYIGRWRGLLLLILFLGYVLFQIWLGRKEGGNGEIAEADLLNTRSRWVRAILFLTLGVVALVVGAYFLVKGAIVIAQIFGMSQRLIGLTIVAVGTSLPELATSVVAASRGKSDISIGNVLGSNVFNILFIVGLVGLITPVGFTSQLLRFDVPVMIGMSLLLWLFFWGRAYLGRGRGVALLLLYALYVVAISRG